ncbi:ABC-transporter, subfamily H member 01 [Frankliniella occidentalis]|uniref:ABC transporter G family member 20-like n=1 Tax=Frankliniella occidentalis TaxID=133901 RepID=A0A9C6X9M7_FRAOC|nr:ABC transporter G family member 20-like [Frankliniella occidentalis]KAE8751826.1 ABC-transporter, subfamily H member 01 [Frankliniella occidentalis]
MEASTGSYAVCVRGACKAYGSRRRPLNVLENLDMSVLKGSIYGLLGASGCGKTTLLSCTVGRRRLDAGSVWVLGGRPGEPGSGVPGPRIGYMPQEVALVGELTVRETLFYFGWIFGMTDDQIEERIAFLQQLLDLPPKNKFVKLLSGGQQRRVSFAAALVHDPELLILDEPTVGLDPILRQAIWDYLVKITRDDHKTVIITTHYIEEAKQAHSIGLMRAGRLLAEDSPSQLLDRYGSATLEEVFLILSSNQGPVDQGPMDAALDQASVDQGAGTLPMTASSTEALHQSNGDIATISPNGNDSLALRKLPVNNNGKPCNGGGYDVPVRARPPFSNMFKGHVKALLAKSFLRILRHLGALGFIFIFPVLEVGVFFTAIGGDPQGLQLSVVNEELYAMNLSTCDEYSSLFGKPGSTYTGGTDDDYGQPVGNCSVRMLSCAFLGYLDHRMAHQVFYKEKGEALNVSRAGDSIGVLHFGPNFTEWLEARRRYGSELTAEEVDQGEIPIWLDMSNRQLGTIMTKSIVDSYHAFSRDLLSTCHANPKIGEIPVHFEEPVYGVENPNFAVFAAPGIILTMIFFLTTGLTATVMITEKQEGLWDRSLVAGVTAWESLLAHVVTQGVLMGIQAALALIMMFLVFKVPCAGHMGDVIFLVFITGMTGMCFGFFVSVSCETVTTANFLSLGSFYPIILLSGVIWPLEGMSTVLRWIALCLPVTLSTTSLRNIMLRGWGLTEPQVYIGFVVTGLWAAGLITICMIILKYRK